MKVLAIVESNVSDPSWIEDYTREVTAMITKLGGRYITRTDNVELLEGEERPQYSIVTEFPSKQIALDFYHSAEYQPYRAARQKGAQCKFLLVAVENGTE